MKYYYKIVLTMVALMTSQLSIAQWTDVINNNINFRYAVQDNHYTGANDADGQCDPTIKTDLYPDQPGQGATWTGFECYTWDCVAPCYNYDNPIVHSFYDMQFNTEMWIYAEMFESDNSNECSYTVNGIDNDDNHWEGYATFRDGQNYMRITYPSTDFYPGAWNPNLGQSGSGWIFPDAPYFNQIWKQVWRYRYGDNNGALLNFGTIAIGQSKRDVNSNRTVLPNDGLMWYTHTTASTHSSPDVWYEFTLAQPAEVSITTTHSRTDFDTYIKLWDINNNFIALDDDSGPNGTSLITEKLCAGTYKVMVEGYSSNTGVFELTISASAPGPLSSNHSIIGESCPGEADGSVIVSGFNNGVTPYTFNWNNTTSTSLSFYGLEEGMYPLFITDACGTTTTETIVVPGDTTPPTAVCINEYTINVSQGNLTSLVDHPDIFSQGSYDNCGIYAYSASQIDFTVSDVGTNTVTMYVVDESENLAECNFTLIVNNTTGIAEAELLSELNIYPNPNTGIFNLDLTGADIQDNARISILDASGREIYSSAASKSNIQIDLGKTASGFYLLRLTNDGITASKRISIL